MKDLYKRLGVASDASADDVRRAMAAADEPTRQAAAHILLTPRRRVVYDRNHRLLTTIGQLRGRLALGMRPFWSHGHHQDFAKPFAPSGKLDPLAAMGTGTRWRRRGTRLNWLWCILLLALIAACVWIYRR